jgi:hypothetical protein
MLRLSPLFQTRFNSVSWGIARMSTEALQQIWILVALVFDRLFLILSAKGQALSFKRHTGPRASQRVSLLTSLFTSLSTESPSSTRFSATSMMLKRVPVENSL